MALKCKSNINYQKYDRHPFARLVSEPIKKLKGKQMRNPYLVIIFLLFGINSCTEEYKVDLQDIDPKLIVECSLLDIDSVHYVKLSLSKASFSKAETDTTLFGIVNKFQPVTDALVIISDNNGTIDTLIGEPDSVYYWNPLINDSLFGLNDFSLSKGYYCSRKLKLSSGITYFLNIQWKGDEYNSSSYMPIVPKIDSVGYAYTQGETGKENYYIPYIWFKDDPNTRDYYLFKTGDISGVWSRAILSDEFLKTEVNGIDVFKGEAIDYWRNAYPYSGMPYKIEMHSITKEIYDYYKALIGQFRNDGGVYTPSPASPPTNISNGALGYFRASSVQVVEDIMPYPNK
jgi:hypothetical protein